MTYPSITNLKQFFGGGAESSQPCGCTLGPGDRSGSGSSICPAPRLHNQDDPHLSRPSSGGEANWQRRGDLCRPAVDNEDFRGDGGALTGLGDALTGDVDTFTGEDWRDSPRSAVPFSIVSVKCRAVSLILMLLLPMSSSWVSYWKKKFCFNRNVLCTFIISRLYPQKEKAEHTKRYIRFT